MFVNMSDNFKRNQLGETTQDSELTLISENSNDIIVYKEDDLNNPNSQKVNANELLEEVGQLPKKQNNEELNTNDSSVTKDTQSKNQTNQKMNANHLSADEKVGLESLSNEDLHKNVLPVDKVEESKDKSNQNVILIDLPEDKVEQSKTENSHANDSSVDKDQTSGKESNQRLNSNDLSANKHGGSKNEINEEVNLSVPLFSVHEMSKIHELVTLDDALKLFNLYSFLRELDSSLENVRRHKITKSDHEKCFKETEKAIKELSLKYHPDSVAKLRGTANEKEAAQKFQASINAILGVLRYLNASFIDDIGTDHKFQFYTKLNIASLCNENEVKGCIYQMKFKISVISRIKQKDIILSIRRFLIESKDCISNYLQNNIDEFIKSQNCALFYLNRCIDGYKKLCAEFKEMENSYEISKDEHMFSFVKNMQKESKRDLMLLVSLENWAKPIWYGSYNFFSTEEYLDPYFVSPFVWYINVFIMCNAMVRGAKLMDYFRKQSFNVPKFNEMSELKPLYYLASYINGNNAWEYQVKKIVYKVNGIYYGSKFKKNTWEIEPIFREILRNVNKKMEIKFNVDHYTEVMIEDVLALQIEKCVAMMNEFNEKKQDVSEGIEELMSKTEKIEGIYEDILQSSQNMNNEIEEIFESNREIKETLSVLLSSHRKNSPQSDNAHFSETLKKNKEQSDRRKVNNIELA